MKMILDCPDDRITPELLKLWAKEAAQNISLKLMVGSLDKELDADIISVIGLIVRSEITEYQSSLLTEKST